MHKQLSGKVLTDHSNVLADEKKINKKLFLGGSIDLTVRYNEPKKLYPLKIASVAYAMKRQGEFPVIFLSLKDIKGKNYHEIESGLRNVIKKLFYDHRYLLNSTHINTIR